MEYTTEQIQEMAKIEANDKKHENIKLDYQDGIYYGFQQGFEMASKLLDVTRRSEQLCRIFFPDGRTTSATKCQFCGKEKWEH